ncbi:MAG: hypothetical protein UY56_C0006G0018 [Parcubacteria group bacterium GW2011_GWA1_50_14]|nr:MAG: hypothetical protein UY56_C0006G0018 [Parcubacteria group bacterium GW2011_GWA1_50_14]
MKTAIVLLVLALALVGCSGRSQVPVDTPVVTDAVPSEVVESTDAPQIEVENVELSIPDCGPSVTQLADRGLLSSYPVECIFLFEGTIPEDPNLDISYPEQIHQIWLLNVASQDLLPDTASGSFWMIRFGDDYSALAQDFLRDKCALTEGGLRDPAVMRYLDGDVLRGEERACP